MEHFSQPLRSGRAGQSPHARVTLNVRYQDMKNASTLPAIRDDNVTGVTAPHLRTVLSSWLQSARGSLQRYPGEVVMQAMIEEEVILTTGNVQSRPEILSYDCGDECSLDHWLEVYWLVEEEFEFARDTDAEMLGQ